MLYPLLIDEMNFDLAQIVSAVPTRNPETGEPRLDLQLVQDDGSASRVTLLGDRAVAVVWDLRRQRACRPWNWQQEHAA